jgi:hypothetical protein
LRLSTFDARHKNVPFISEQVPSVYFFLQPNILLTLACGEPQNVTDFKAQPQTVTNLSLVGTVNFRNEPLASARDEPTSRAGKRV